MLLELLWGYAADACALGGELQEPGVHDWGALSAVLCGQKELAESVTAYLSEKGVSKEAILTNW